MSLAQSINYKKNPLNIPSKRTLKALKKWFDDIFKEYDNKYKKK